MKRVAFITCTEHSALAGDKIAEDDHLAAKALAQRDVEAVPWIWNGTPPANVDLAILRSPWDWTSDARGFDAFLASFESSGIPLENRNARAWQEKTYLERLAKNGAPTVPSRLVGADDSFETAVRDSGWQDLVLKPSLGAGGRRTVRFRAEDWCEHAVLAESILAQGTLLLQPFSREIVEHGEWSLVFFDGEYSHALKKHAASGEFRVQDDFGGIVKAAVAPERVVADAKNVLAASGEDFLYARVDGFVSDTSGDFTVTELEVVEPELFFRTSAEAPERFARAVLRRLGVAG